MADCNYGLKWTDHKDNLVETLHASLSADEFTDIIIVCEGKEIHAHRVILSSCSLWFKKILLTNPYSNLVIVMHNVDVDDLECVINYIYSGEIVMIHNRMKPVMELLQLLRVKGLVNVEERSAYKPVQVSKLSSVHLISSTSQQTVRMLKAFFPVSEFKRIRPRSCVSSNGILGSATNSHISNAVANPRISMRLCVNLPTATASAKDKKQSPEEKNESRIPATDPASVASSSSASNSLSASNPSESSESSDAKCTETMEKLKNELLDLFKQDFMAAELTRQLIGSKISQKTTSNVQVQASFDDNATAQQSEFGNNPVSDDD